MKIIAHFYNGSWRGCVYDGVRLVCMSLSCFDFLHAKRVGSELALQYIKDWSGL